MVPASSGEGTTSIPDGFRAPLSAESCRGESGADEGGALLHKTGRREGGGGATVFQSSLNVSKICMGTGALALPFAAEKGEMFAVRPIHPGPPPSSCVHSFLNPLGALPRNEEGGLLFNAAGLLLICLWNYYSATCLLRCLEYLPRIDAGGGKCVARGRCGVGTAELERRPERKYGAMDSDCCGNPAVNREPTEHGVDQIDSGPPPPDGTTTYGTVAWYASGPRGLMVLDFFMILLSFGVVTAYEVAMMSFIDDMPLTTGSRKIDLLIPSAVIALLSCASDLSFLSKFSGMGLLALGLSFTVIFLQGLKENGLSGFGSALESNQWPDSLSAASSWFGVAVFGFGVVPYVFNFRKSMADPRQIDLSLQMGLLMAYAAYIIMSNGIQVLFSPSHIFDGDVLQAMPDTWVSLAVRLLMTFVVAMTAPLVVLPCGELLEGKLGIDSLESPRRERIVVRMIFCIACTIFAEFLGSGFVHVVSFIGCFCVAMAGFVLPPLFCIQLSGRRKENAVGGFPSTDFALLCDAGALVLGIVATVFTSTLTFGELVARAGAK